MLVLLLLCFTQIVVVALFHLELKFTVSSCYENRFSCWNCVLNSILKCDFYSCCIPLASIFGTVSISIRKALIGKWHGFHLYMRAIWVCVCIPKCVLMVTLSLRFYFKAPIASSDDRIIANHFLFLLFFFSFYFNWVSSCSTCGIHIQCIHI